MLIWIRHAPKEYANGKGPVGSKQYDSPIDSSFDTMLDIELMVDEIVTKYGKPNIIITSPFLRTRQTSLYVREYIKDKYDTDVNVETNKDISEYLGFCRRGENGSDSVHPETFLNMDKNIRFDESQVELRNRVKNHLESLRQHKGCIWIVTHGIVMSRIYEILFGEKLYRPQTLDYFAYESV